MARSTLVLLSLMLAACAASKAPAIIVLPTVAYPFDRNVLVRDDVASCSNEILNLAWEGRANFERAAFLRLGENGRLTCDVWPATFSYRRAEWWGPPPDGTTAIVHSHPVNFPDPSVHDVMEALRLGIPLIVVTPNAVTMAMPRDGRIVRVPRNSAATARK